MEEERQYFYHPGPNRFTFFAGVIMPAISITVEASTHICAGVFFDPIPTIWHLMLVIFVPLAQLQVWFAIRRRDVDRLALAGFLNAIVIGISAFYSIVYIPLLPMGILALMFGVGLLPLAPYLSLVAGLMMRRQLRLVAATTPRRSFALKKRGLLAGLALTTLAFGMIELPATLTVIGLQMATSKSPQMRKEGICFLRDYGDRQAMLRSSFGKSGWATNLIASAFSIPNPITPEDAQKIYYRVTGEAIDPSMRADLIGTRLVPRETVGFDRIQGGTEVGNARLEGLSLASSKFNATVDADGGVGYMEWTLVFKNDYYLQREARAEVQLPPGGVVSRLTLWVNGEEREAAFAGRGHVREAYQKVAIQQRRDPVLVTTSGRDRILVQCFPVPSNGEMKIRFGVTIPLVLDDQTHARLIFPHFISKNFAVPDGVVHVVSVSGKAPIWPNNSTFITGRAENIFSVNGEVKDDDLSERGSSITLTRYGSKEMWSEDPFNPGFIITQSVVEHTPAHLQRIVLLVDTSASMQGYVEEIQNAIKTLPSDFDVKILLADTDIPAPGSIALTNLYGQDAESIQWTLTNANFAGGADNGPALLEAWTLAAQKPGNNVIVWIHSPQRMLLTPIDELRQKWEQRPYGPKLYSVQTSNGSDEIEKKLDGIDEVKLVARTGVLSVDLENLFAQLTGRMKTLEYVRSSIKLDKHTEGPAGVHTTDHLARLWANDEVTRILAPHDASLTDAAITLAARYQLVTPVTGAVVLETAEQYRGAGLEPVDPGTVPTIPEPEMVVLLIIAGAFMIWIMYMKYRKAGRGTCTV
jgi:Vault protein inter-alpha-trypsin domain